MKVVIIIVLKLDSRTTRGKAQIMDHESQPSQCKDKSFYYPSFKTWLESQPGQGSGHKLRGSTQVDLSQHMDKNGYYHSFKTWLESQPRQGLTRVGRVNSIDLVFF